MTQNNQSVYHQKKQLSSEVLKNIINTFNEDKDFIYQEAVLSAISTIVTAVNESHISSDNPIQKLIESIVHILQTQPISYRHMQITKSALAKKPLVMQLLILIQDIVNRGQQSRSQKKLIWLSIAMHTAVVLTHYQKKIHANNIMMQFKLAQFSGSSRRTWIWSELPDMPTISHDNILSILTNILEKNQESTTDLDSKNLITQVKLKEDMSIAIAKLGQIEKIVNAYQEAHYLKIKKPKKPRKAQTDNTKVEPINLAEQKPFYQPNNEHTPYYWDTPFDDIEHSTIPVEINFLSANTETYEGLSTSFEEIVDNYDEPYISYERLPDPLFRQSAPLQTIDISLQQHHMSQRDLGLNSSTSVLSLLGYQLLFAALVHDAKSASQLNYKICASILLLSMITALPIKLLMLKGYIGHRRIFSIGVKRAYIKHTLGITERSEVFDSAKHENEFDEVKIPIPLWLIESLLSIDIPSIDDFNTYLAMLRFNLGLPYLSLKRVKTALHIILSRYTPHSHNHIADIICRTPASHAPAMYYSSHSSETLLGHYRSALSVLNKAGSFDLSYITPWHKYTLGSGLALTSEYVREIIGKLKGWVHDSSDAATHFNRTSIFVWFVFCLLTGVRPNNGIGKISDIDLDMGWLEIDDKPNKQVQNQRLIPLCTTLLRYLTDYRSYLIRYQLNSPLEHDISISIDEIRLGDNDVALLRLLSDSFNTLKIIKRGDAYHMTKDIINANPYWTRHFVRTQLEKLGVDLTLINAVIGHEKARQEGLGCLSSLSKAKIKVVSGAFEHIARILDLHLDSIDNNDLQH